MATKPGRGNGCKERATGHNSRGSGHVDTGLPVQPLDAQGSERGAVIRSDTGERPACSPLRDADGGSASRSGWQDNFSAVFGDCRRLRISSLGDGRHGNGSQEGRIQDTRSAQPPQLPDVPYRYWEPLEEADSETASAGVCNGDAVLEAENNSQFLSKLRTKALVKLDEILSLPLPRSGDADHVRMASIQKDAANQIVTASLKADENCFRRRNNDALARLTATVAAELAKRTPLTIDNMVAQ